MTKILLIIMFCMSSGFSAVKQPDWTSLINKRVKLQMKDSSKVEGVVMYCQDSLVTVMIHECNISTFVIKNVKSFSEVKIAYGPIFSLKFGSIGFNADIHNFNLFANTSLFLPIYTRGQLFTFSTGAGKLVDLSSHKWKLNFFSGISSVSTGLLGDWMTIVSAGVGIGLQYTGNNSSICSIKLPLIGYTVHSYMRNKKLVFSHPRTFKENFVAFHVCNFISVPIIAIGANL